MTGLFRNRGTSSALVDAADKPGGIAKNFASRDGGGFNKARDTDSSNSAARVLGGMRHLRRRKSKAQRPRHSGHSNNVAAAGGGGGGGGGGGESGGGSVNIPGAMASTFGVSRRASGRDTPSLRARSQTATELAARGGGGASGYANDDEAPHKEKLRQALRRSHRWELWKQLLYASMELIDVTTDTYATHTYFAVRGGLAMLWGEPGETTRGEFDVAASQLAGDGGEEVRIAYVP